MGYFYCGGFERKRARCWLVLLLVERYTTEAMIMEVALSLAW